MIKKILISVLLLYSTLNATNYYEMTKLQKQAKGLPYLETRAKKDKEFKAIEKKVSQMNEKDRKYIRPKLDAIYKENREIEKRLMQERINDTMKIQSSGLSSEYMKVKKARTSQRVY